MEEIGGDSALIPVSVSKETSYTTHYTKQNIYIVNINEATLTFHI